VSVSGGQRPRPIVLIVLDGFGIGRDPVADAIRASDMPNWRSMLARWPHSELAASEEAVGLPAGQMGNSEVGHLNLGAGRPVLQDLPRIDAAIADGSFFERPALIEACEAAVRGQGRLNIVGLIGPGGVHANDRHLVALAELAARRQVPEVRVHALLDGRDTPPRSAIDYIPDLQRRLAETHPDARIATVGGRYFGMDRDKRWDRTELAYDAIVFGVGERAPDASAAVSSAYGRGENDEFVRPTVIDGVDGAVHDGEPIIHLNFRADRARQLTHALADRDFTGFDRVGPNGEAPPSELRVVTMTAYESGLPVAVAFPPEEARSLAQVFSEAGWRQLHVAETEKYAHVTYFFNGGPGGALSGRGPAPRPESEGCHLRPPAGDERRRRDGSARGHDHLRAARLHPCQLREPRHGRPHRHLGGDGPGGRIRRRVPGADLGCRPRGRCARSRWPGIAGRHHGGPRECGSAPGLGRVGRHGPLAQPGPDPLHGSCGSGTDAARWGARGRRADDPRPGGPPEGARGDRALAARGGSRVSPCYHPTPLPWEVIHS